MKKYLFIFVALVLSQTVFSQCSDLFFSEYVEGNQSNKALEIYNPTSAPINLANYQIHRWNNGTDVRDELYTQVLSGTIPAKGVWVLVKDSSPSEIVYFQLRNKANAFITASCGLGSTNRTLCHNGNDAYTLEKVAGTVVVDIFGQVGIDPGNPTAGGGWNNNPATNYTAADSTGSSWTTDHTLRRKQTVLQGVTVNPGGGGATNAFNVSVEWDSISFDVFAMFDSLGNHHCDCKDYNGIINPKNSLLVETYPNPSTDFIYINSAENISEVSIQNINGAVAYHELLNGDTKNFTIDISKQHIAAGEYLLYIKAKNGGNITKAIVITK